MYIAQHSDDWYSVTWHFYGFGKSNVNAFLNNELALPFSFQAFQLEN